MGIEALVETSMRLLPNWHAVRVEDVVFRSPFKFYRSQPRTLRLSAVLELAGKDIMAFCRLEGSRSLHGREEPEVTTHFVGKVHLSRRPTELPGRGKKIEDPRREASVGAGDIYRVYFHGPAYQVIEEAWSFGLTGSAAQSISRPTATWIDLFDHDSYERVLTQRCKGNRVEALPGLVWGYCQN